MPEQNPGHELGRSGYDPRYNVGGQGPPPITEQDRAQQAGESQRQLESSLAQQLNSLKESLRAQLAARAREMQAAAAQRQRVLAEAQMRLQQEEREAEAQIHAHRLRRAQELQSLASAVERYEQQVREAGVAVQNPYSRSWQPSVAPSTPQVLTLPQGGI
jgi:hypothetical protein